MDERIEFFDSNVLIAASVLEHPHHRQSLARLAAVAGTPACGSHTLAEVYNTLTSQRRGYGIPPVDAARIIERTCKKFTVIALTPTETLRTIQDAALHAIAGAMIYDALVLACARKAKSMVIYTGNVKHFRQIAPDLASIIREP